MIRFFVEPNNINDKTIMLSPADSAHIRSLGLRTNDMFVVCDGRGTDYMCHLDEGQANSDAGHEHCIVQILSRQKSRAEPTVDCTAYIAYATDERLEYAVQKSVEMGAHKIALYMSERSPAMPDDARNATERLQRIALETAKASGRGIIPEVSASGDYKNVLHTATANEDLAILFYENEKNLNIMTVLHHFFPSSYHIAIAEPLEKIRSVAIITGPERGFEPSEIELAQSKDIPIVSLGPRLLRSETAPIVALSAIMYHTGNL